MIWLVLQGGRSSCDFEDIDRSRCRHEWEDRLIEDLGWLGVHPGEPPARQSDRMHLYAAALDRLWAAGMLFQCNCSRADIRAALSAPQEGAIPVGPDGPVYPGTCRGTPRTGSRPDGVLRLDIAACSGARG